MKAVFRFCIEYPTFVAAVAIVLMALPLILKVIDLTQRLGVPQ